MSAPFVAEIKMWAGNFAPTGYALCDGQLLPISQNTALFSLLGTFYGGDGKSTFALPNMQDSVPINQGQSSASGTDYFIGEQSGVPFVTLITTEMPVHTHTAQGGSSGTSNNPQSLTWGQMAVGRTGTPLYQSANTNLTTMNPQSLGIAGGSQPHNNMMPFIVLTFIIALQGIFPARS
ncbi:MAG TPA: tail fiber protein [Blastocatellia bacterium]|nr:tail fiber protein [Blastocatellia bacterium]